MVCGLWSTGVLWFVVCGLWSTGVTNLVNLGVRVGVRVGVWRPKIVRESQDSLTINYSRSLIELSGDS